MADSKTIMVPVTVTVDDLLDNVEQIKEGCREEITVNGIPDKCWQPAEFLLWGKLFPPESLGPRCYDHAADHVGHLSFSTRMLEQSAILDLRGLCRVR